MGGTPPILAVAHIGGNALLQRSHGKKPVKPDCPGPWVVGGRRTTLARTPCSANWRHTDSDAPRATARGLSVSVLSSSSRFLPGASIIVPDVMTSALLPPAAASAEPMAPMAARSVAHEPAKSAKLGPGAGGGAAARAGAAGGRGARAAM